MNAYACEALLRRIRFCVPCLVVFTALLFVMQSAYAWPERSIRIIVPFSAGGTTDLLGRLLSDGIAPYLGQSVVVVNKGGAGGSIGAAEVARAPADGYTLLLGTPGTQVTNSLVYK